MEIKNKKLIGIISIIVVVIIAFVVGKFFVGNNYATNWKVSENSPKGVEVKYPETLGTTYINTVDWPPRLQYSTIKYNCNESGNEVAEGGITKQETINGHVYCVIKASEGAAGSTYTTFVYKYIHGDGTAFMTFVLRYPQCENYDDPQKSACKSEESSFDINKIIDQIVQTVK